MQINKEMSRLFLKNANNIVIKVGTSLLTHEHGKLNLKRIEILARVLTDLHNMGKKISLVTSGAVGTGVGTMNLDKKPSEIEKKQALAAIGQAFLMRIYQNAFGEYNQKTAQILLTKDVFFDQERLLHAQNTMNALFEYGVIPIINENDTIATDEIVFGDNDRLSAYVSRLTNADLLILLSDIDGLYYENPKINPNAKLVSQVEKITIEIEQMANGKGSDLSTGGMFTKILAAKIAQESGIKTIIANGENPEIIYNILKGEELGTLFL